MSRLDLKVVLLGGQYVGKTSLVERFLHDRFNEKYSITIGGAFGTKTLEINGHFIQLAIWDTAGAERFESITQLYYRGAKAAIVCYDPAVRTSFDRGKFWIRELKKHEKKCRVYVCETKLDIIDSDDWSRQIDSNTALKFSTEMNSVLFGTSSKTGENINELFYSIALDYMLTGANTYNVDKVVNLKESKDRLTCCSPGAKTTTWY